VAVLSAPQHREWHDSRAQPDHIGVDVILAVIFALVLLCGLLILKLSTANKERAELRARVDSLKRQLVRMR
jgi:hypothetical protein